MGSLIERLGARALGALPGDWVERLAGPPVSVRGRTLDPHCAASARLRPGRPALHELTPREARAASDESIRLAAGPSGPLARLEERRVPGAQGPLDARLHTPLDLDGPRPLILYFHQGGFVIGHPGWSEAFCAVLARGARCPVLSVAYRLGPEHRFPAAQDDAWAAYRWAREHAGEVGGDPARVAVAGDSAGGGLAAMLSQRARDEGVAPPALQLLVYPWLCAWAENDAYRDFAVGDPVGIETLRWFLRHYPNGPGDHADPRLSPGLAGDLAGLAPALVYTAGFDPLCDEGEDYAQRLEAAGVPVVFRCYESLPHSFTALGGVSPAAARAQAEIAREVDVVLSRGVGSARG